MENPLISVIIPIYNVEKYLDKCIKSVILQTYRNIEIFLVDDGSTDKSGKLCDLLAKEDNRIIVIHKENGGLSDARNAALDKIRGEYVTFIDSDDYVAKDYIQHLYSLIKENNTILSVCQMKKICNNFQDEEFKREEEKEIIDRISAMKNYLYQKGFLASANCKMYSRRIFDNIRYPVGYYYEDMAIIISILKIVPIVAVSNQEKYFYLQRENSIMREQFNEKKMHRIEIANNIRDDISKEYPDLIKAANARCFLAGIQTFREVPNKKKFRKYQEIAWKQICLFRKSVVFDLNAKRTMRFMALSTYGGKRILYLLGRIYSYFA